MTPACTFVPPYLLRQIAGTVPDAAAGCAAALTVGWVLTLVRPTHGALLPWIARDPTELTSAYTAAGVSPMWAIDAVELMAE